MRSRALPLVSGLLLAACSKGDSGEPPQAAGTDEERALAEAAEMLEERPEAPEGEK